MRYVRTKIQHVVGNSADDAHALARRFFARPVVMLQGDRDTFSRYPNGRYGCQVLAQGGKDRRERSYAYWVYKVLLSGTPLTHARVGGSSRWKQLQFQGRNHLEQSVEPWASKGGSWTFNHDFCHVLGVGHVGEDMWASKAGRAALLGREITEAIW